MTIETKDMASGDLYRMALLIQKAIEMGMDFDEIDTIGFNPYSGYVFTTPRNYGEFQILIDIYSNFLGSWTVLDEDLGDEDIVIIEPIENLSLADCLSVKSASDLERLKLKRELIK
jgi:hypothetical protein